MPGLQGNRKSTQETPLPGQSQGTGNTCRQTRLGNLPKVSGKRQGWHRIGAIVCLGKQGGLLWKGTIPIKDCTALLSTGHRDCGIHEIPRILFYPFPGSPVYTFGHRNPQGLAWDAQGRLWATEHGSNATDELNLIEPGNNYGWPIIRGDEKTRGLEVPVIHSGGETWAPSGLAFLDGSLFFAGLRSQSLYEAVIENKTVILRRHLNKNFGRLRDVVVGPDNLLYLLTSNRDGRGIPAADDDQIIRINHEKF